MDEFAKACNIHLDLNDFTMSNALGTGQKMTTTSLYTKYARQIVIEHLKYLALSLSLEEHDLVNLSHDASEEVSIQIKELRDAKMKGSLSKVESQTVRPNVTTDGDDSGEKVSLGVLCERIISCRLAAWDNPNPPRQAEGIYKFAKCIASAQKVLRIIAEQRDPIIEFETALSIAILCCTLVNIISVVFNMHIRFSPPSFREKFESDMIARNWCPSRIGDLQDPANTPVAYIRSLLPSYQTLSHLGCNEQRCLVRPSTVETMTGQHRKTCGGDCPPTVMDETKLIQMWNRGGIPGLRQVESDGPAEFEVLNCITQPFVAISHVWSHGLGNPSKNELPSCQVRFLSNLVKQLAGNDTLLWIDTLSVPIELESKRIAISKLRTVYTKASKVLVIDRDLMHVGLDKREQILQLLSSEWQRRLWTLQEGRLTSDLYVQFKDSAVPVSELIAEKTALESVSDIEVFNFFNNLMQDFRSRFSQAESVHSQFLALTNDLASRSVTVKSDEPICLATLLGLKLEDFNPYPTMVDIYRSLPIIPPELMFLNLPRLQVPGLTWAPSTFLASLPIFIQSEKDVSRLGHISVQGLHFVKDCLFLDKDLDFYRDSRISAEVYIIDSSDGQKFAIKSLNTILLDGVYTRAEPSRLISKPVVIWQKSNFATFSDAVLVSMFDEKDGVAYCRFEMALSGWKVGGEGEDFHQRMLERSGGILQTVSAEFMAGKSLCVG